MDYDFKLQPSPRRRNRTARKRGKGVSPWEVFRTTPHARAHEWDDLRRLLDAGHEQAPRACVPGVPDTPVIELLRAVLDDARRVLWNEFGGKVSEADVIATRAWAADPDLGLISLRTVCDALRIDVDAISRALLSPPRRRNGRAA